MNIKSCKTLAASAMVIIVSGIMGVYAQQCYTQMCGNSDPCPNPVASPVCPNYTTATACNSAPTGTSYPPNDAVLVCANGGTKQCTDDDPSTGTLHCPTGGHDCTWANGACQSNTEEPDPGSYDCSSS
jgi:hypothetical protein